MDVSELLRRCRNAEQEIMRIDEQIAQRRESMERMTPFMDKIGASRSDTLHDRMAEFVATIDELERERAARLEEQCNDIIALNALLETLPEHERRVMYQFYVRCKSVVSIAQNVHYTEGYVRKIKCDAVRRLTAMTQEALLAVLPPWYG